MHPGKTAGWIEMLLGTEVGPDQTSIVLDGGPLFPWEGGKRMAWISCTVRPTLLTLKTDGDFGYTAQDPCGTYKVADSNYRQLWIHVAGKGPQKC